jgi:hypothetical protein
VDRVEDRIARARDIVRAADLPAALRRVGDKDFSYYNGRHTVTAPPDGLTAEVLAQSLQYVVKPKLHRIRAEDAVALGASKYRGLPQLPPGVEWPRGQYFLAQFNLADLHPLDLYNAFPAEGWLYLFFNTAAELTVVHYGGPVDALRVRPYPPRETLPTAKYYLDTFLKASSLMEFRPRAMFCAGGDAYDLSEVTNLIPKRLRDEVAEALRCKVVDSDSDVHLFGRPLYWQGEDEEFDSDDDDEGGADDDEDEDGTADDGGPRLMLFQDEFGEGHVHVWIDESAARRRAYDECWLDYSGT